MAPESVVDLRTLEALSKAWATAEQAAASSFDLAAAVSHQAIEALLTEVIRPHCDLRGAPPQAWPLGLAAARAGYRLGIAMLGPIDQGDPDQDAIVDVVESVHRMYVYDLYVGIPGEVGLAIGTRLTRLITETGAPQRGDFEEHAGLCFALGLATAVVQTDRT